MPEVAPSGHSARLKQPVSSRAQKDALLLRLVRASFVVSQGIYGAPLAFLDLHEAVGHPIYVPGLVQDRSSSAI